MQKRHFIVGAVACALASGAANASALSQWPAQPMPASLGDPTLLVDGNGTAYLVGLDGMTAIAPFGAPLGAPERVLSSEPRPWDAVSGVSADGELVIAYTRTADRPRVHRRVRVVLRTPAGVTSAPVTISQLGRTADTPALAVAAGGEAIVAFVRHDADARWHVQYALRRASGMPFGPPRTVSGADGIVSRGTRIDVAADPKGGGLLTWVTRPADRSTPGRLMALVVDRDGAGAPVALEARAAPNSYGIPHGRTAIAYASDGSGVLAWVGPRGSATNALDGDMLRSAPITHSGIGDAKTLGSYRGPLVGWDATAEPGGRATVVWASYPDYGADTPGGHTTTVWTRSRLAGGSWSDPKALSNPKIHVSPGSLRRSSVVAAGDGTGNVLALWGERSAYASSDDHLWLSARTTAGTWTPVQQVTPTTGAVMPAAAASPSGLLAVTWMTFAPGAAPGATLMFGAFG